MYPSEVFAAPGMSGDVGPSTVALRRHASVKSNMQRVFRLPFRVLPWCCAGVGITRACFAFAFAFRKVSACSSFPLASTQLRL